MKTIILILISVLTVSCNYNDKGGLEDKIETLELTYTTWACDCANWTTKEDLEKYSDNNGDTLAVRSIFIEPDNQSLELPDTLGYNSDIIRFTGKFYKNKGFPKGYKSFQGPEKARVFRYTKFEVLRSNYRE